MTSQLGFSIADAAWNWTPVAPGWRVSATGPTTHSHALVGWTVSGKPVIALNGALSVWDGPFTVFYLS